MKQSLIEACNKMASLKESLNLVKIKARLEELDELQQALDFWNDPDAARRTIKEYNTLKELYESFYANEKALTGLLESVEEMTKVYDEEMFMLIEEEYHDVIKNFEEFEIKVLLSHDYDHSNAILEIHPGAGGTESQDWAMMLFRMYQRYAQKNGYQFEVLDYQDGDEAGMKSCSVLIKGDLAYGYLKGESGVHRLVRISPFDASGRRHTSFASVEITPEFNDEIEILAWCEFPKPYEEKENVD